MTMNIATTNVTPAASKLGTPTYAGLWLGLGCISAVFACGGPWDIPIAAWLLPIFLVRFGRISAGWIAAIGVLAAMLVQSLAFTLLNAIPFNMMTLVLALVVSVVYALPLIVDRSIGGQLSDALRILLLPVAMVAAEFSIGSVLPLGTAIGMRAITQGENLALLQIISITGPYVIAFLLGITATVANRVMEAPSSATLLRYAAPLAAGLITVVALGQARLAVSTPSAAPATVKVAAITPDLDARRDASELLDSAALPPTSADAARVQSPQVRAAYGRIAAALLADTRRAARAGAKIVVWSETAAPTTTADKPALLARVGAVAREEGIYISAAVGVPFERNETFLFGPDGRQLWHYRKNHPVPGMEPVAPFDNSVPVVSTPYGRLANLICFDGDFPALARVNADIMLVPSWDWPEVTFAHTMRMVRLRAIENGYALVRPVFNGVAGAFDTVGRTLAMQETMSGGAHVMLVDVPTRSASTIYNRIGDLFAWICCMDVILLIILSFRRVHSHNIGYPKVGEPGVTTERLRHR
jgi:apolipoprotein N-acyltransferase